MRSSLVRNAVARKDHEAISRVIESSRRCGNGGGLSIAVCNELGSVYFTIETGSDEEFIHVMSNLAELGFADVAAANAAQDAVMRRAD